MVCFRHYKGNIYMVESIARHTEEETELVIYTDAARKQWWARPRAMFEEKVIVDGKTVPRFEPIELFLQGEDGIRRLRPNLPADVVSALKAHPIFRTMFTLQMLAEKEVRSNADRMGSPQEYQESR